MDYIVTKIPKWDLAKFSSQVNREVGSSMKSVGEVMAIGRTFEESIMKAVRMVDPRWVGFEVFGKKLTKEQLDTVLQRPTDMRLFAIAQAMYIEGYSVDKLHDLTKIDKVGSAQSSSGLLSFTLLCSGSCTSLKISSTPIAL